MTDNSENLIPVFIPPLISLLTDAEKQKGADLTEGEVLQIRDSGITIALTKQVADEIENQRGYPDLDPEQAWQQWRDFKASK